MTHRPLLRALRRRLAGEGGFTLVELLVTIAILGIVLGGIGGLFVSGIRSETSLNQRFQAETELAVGMAKLKRDLHAACQQPSLVVVGPVSSVTIQLPNGGCVDPSGVDSSQPVTWCVRQVGAAVRYQLFRVAGAACAGGTQYADYLTSPAPFTFYPYNVTASSAPAPCNCYALARLHADLSVDVDPARNGGTYRLVDDIAFRNSRAL